MPPITISLLNDGGYETVSYVYKEITMTSISDLNLSYAATIGNFNTFSCQFSYNYYDVYMMSPEGKRILVATDVQPQMDFDKSLVTPDKDDIKQRPEEAQPVSTKKSLAEAVKI